MNPDRFHFPKRGQSWLLKRKANLSQGFQEEIWLTEQGRWGHKHSGQRGWVSGVAGQAEPAASCSKESVQECDPGGELGRQAGFSEKPAGPRRAAGSWEPKWVQLSGPTTVRVTALLRVRTGVGMRLCTRGQPGRPTVMIRAEDRVGRQHLSSSA